MDETAAAFPSLTSISFHEMGSTTRPDPSKPAVDPLINAAKCFLSRRKFEDCRRYASKAREANPNLPAPPQLLAISSVLSVCPPSEASSDPPPDLYAILGLPRFSHDLNAIRAQFQLLHGLINPDKNPYPFAAEARGWVLKAGSVLSDPDLKAQFDKDLRTRKRSAEKGAGATFWTVCPYCYFMYEYESVFQDCALRCSNPNCKRPFAAVAVAAAAAPRPDVVAKGNYVCEGFIPLRSYNGENGGDKGWNWWEAFVTMGSGSGSGKVNEARQDEEQKRKTENPGGGMDLTDDGERAGEEIKKKGNDFNAVVRRKKQAATGKKKVMGKGIRATLNPCRYQGRNMG